MTSIFYKLCIGLCSSFLSLTLSAATLTVADNLIVSVVDDNIVEHGFMGDKSTFTLSRGAHVLVVRYKDVLEDLDFAEERVIESKDFVVKFSLAHEQFLSLKTIEIKNLSQAERFIKSPQLQLMDDKTNPLTMELVDLADYKLAKQVIMALTSLTVTPSPNNTLLPLKASTTSNSTKSIHAKANQFTVEKNDSASKVDSLTMLKYWWQTASNADKKQFILFAKKQ